MPARHPAFSTQTCYYRPSFTLIELLIVISIIAVLAAMLLPVLSKAKSTALRTVCLSQLGQLGKATTMYADDGDSRLPYSGMIHPSAPNTSSLWQFDGEGKSQDFISLYYDEYLSDPRLYYCPSNSDITESTELGDGTYFQHTLDSTVWDNHIGGRPNKRAWIGMIYVANRIYNGKSRGATSLLDDPAEPLIADMSLTDTARSGWWWVNHPTSGPGYFRFAAGPDPKWRQVVYLDGHARARPSSELNTTDRHVMDLGFKVVTTYW